MFRTVPLSIIRSFSLYTHQWNILILLYSCLQTCVTYTVAECTVRNSWWWTEELSETCRVSFPNKFEKLVHLVGFIIRNLSRYTATCHDARSHVTMHGHMSRCTVTCHDARPHVTMHGHMSRCTVTWTSNWYCLLLYIFVFFHKWIEAETCGLLKTYCFIVNCRCVGRRSLLTGIY
jgi:hypothetical protein